MSPSNERSAEFCRGAVEALEHQSHFGAATLLNYYRALLAAAEAREATLPTAAEVIEACRMALEEVLDALRDDMPLDAAMAHGDTALALIAKWKEVQ